MKNIKMGAYVYNDETRNFNFATDLSAYRKMMFVKYVTNSIIDEDSYDSIVKDLIFDFGIIAICTDIDTSFINVVDDDGDTINPIIFIEQFLEETNVVDIVKANMEIGLLDELNKAVDISIEYKTGIHANPLNEALARLANTLERKVNEVDLDSMMEMAQLFTGMTDELTPENVVNAYMNSNIHKKNVVEIEEVKKQKAEFAEDLDKTIISVVNKKDDSKKATKSKSKGKSKSKEKTEAKEETDKE